MSVGADFFLTTGKSLNGGEAKVVEIIITILFTILLILGLRYCIANSFKAGIIFFTLLLFNKIIYIFVLPIFMSQYIDGLEEGNKSLFPDLTIGEQVHLLYRIPDLIELVAFLFLIIGFYQLWNSKKLSPK
ncbi:hypothetical protein CEY16_14205 [Halalkalibacillus sediminis]|uniref:Uncharacterized protein n=1 Tax=Halalkalibacillus sediminis TaxID=2018042 RepID=A0A2I0QRI5_9BACI|nr:hypothetical protein [Halalkalibacillus sediminis]PKR76955.1 hypothetical protein CEY16_14205 [Halalkalibacillus sediminis]